MDNIGFVTERLQLVIDVGVAISEVCIVAAIPFLRLFTRVLLAEQCCQGWICFRKTCIRCERLVSKTGEPMLILFQKIKASSDEYKKLRKAASDCFEEAEFGSKAATVFKTQDVKEALNSSIQTVIIALELVSRYYSEASGESSH